MANWLSDIFGSKEASYEMAPTQWLQNPEYSEATGARQTLWDKLQGWGSEKGYGAISPDWSNIWDTAAKRIKQYYWGGAGGQAGLADKVRASAAGRGVSESPALEANLTNMGYQEASDLGTLATEVGTKEAEFAETGRQNWLQSLMQLSGMKPSGQWQTADYREEEPSAAAQMLGKAAGIAIPLLTSIFSGGVGGAAGTVGGAAGMGTEFADWFGSNALGSAY